MADSPFPRGKYPNHSSIYNEIFATFGDLLLIMMCLKITLGTSEIRFFGRLICSAEEIAYAMKRFFSPAKSILTSMLFLFSRENIISQCI